MDTQAKALLEASSQKNRMRVRRKEAEDNTGRDRKTKSPQIRTRNRYFIRLLGGGPCFNNFSVMMRMAFFKVRNKNIMFSLIHRI
jgi:hypothetical protein